MESVILSIKSSFLEILNKIKNALSVSPNSSILLCCLVDICVLVPNVLITSFNLMPNNVHFAEKISTTICRSLIKIKKS